MCFGCARPRVSMSLWRRVWMAHRELYNAALQERRDGVVAQQDPDQLRGPVCAADRDPSGATGSGACGRSPVSRPRYGG